MDFKNILKAGLVLFVLLNSTMVAAASTGAATVEATAVAVGGRSGFLDYIIRTMPVPLDISPDPFDISPEAAETFCMNLVRLMHALRGCSGDPTGECARNKLRKVMGADFGLLTPTDLKIINQCPSATMRFSEKKIHDELMRILNEILLARPDAEKRTLTAAMSVWMFLWQISYSTEHGQHFIFNVPAGERITHTAHENYVGAVETFQKLIGPYQESLTEIAVSEGAGVTAAPTAPTLAAAGAGTA